MASLFLPYRCNSSSWFQALRDLPCPAFLDSGPDGPRRGRYDILCAAPLCRVVTLKGKTWRESPEGRRDPLAGSPLQALQAVLDQEGFDPASSGGLPFNGGALGYFGYDLGRSLERLPSHATADIEMPDMSVGIYPWALVVDHVEQSAQLVGREDQDLQPILQRLQQPAIPAHTGFRLSTPFGSNLSPTDYRQRFERVIDYINAGDCYQANLAQRFSAAFEGDTWAAYRSLRRIAPTPYSAYLELPEGRVLSLSPERFIQTDGRHVQTKPIKGTRPRGETPQEDHRLREELLASPKDRAENLMIVDLLRNDLGRTCRTGSVTVPRLFDVETYANVHHLVTTISGELNSPRDALRLLEGAFPGGSITGAPKLRAMEIIEELEPHRRSVYCGSIGYIGFNGRMDTSICIRTLVAHRGYLHCWAGGGLVADSTPDSEYQETLTKIQNLLRCLEQGVPPENRQA